MYSTGIIRASGLPLALLACLVLALVACTSAGSSQAPGVSTDPGGSAPAASSPASASSSLGPTADACQLATAAEVGTAYGFTAATATANPPADANYAYCEYASDDGNTVVLTYISLSQAALAIYDGYKADADEMVTGVGDEAFWDNEVLYVKVGDAFAAIGLRGGSGSAGSVDPTEAGVALGKVIAGRM